MSGSSGEWGGGGGHAREWKLASPGRTAAAHRLAAEAREPARAGLQAGHRTPGQYVSYDNLVGKVVLYGVIDMLRVWAVHPMHTMPSLKVKLLHNID